MSKRVVMAVEAGVDERNLGDTETAEKTLRGTEKK
jgi:hypothetical protein